MRKRREEQGILLIELAAQLGRSPAAISSFEGGLVPKRVTQEEIAAELKCSPIDLWPDEWERT